MNTAAPAMTIARIPASAMMTKTATIPSPMIVPMNCAMMSLPLHVDRDIARAIRGDDSVRVTWTYYHGHAGVATHLTK